MGASRGGGSATRGDATTSRGKREGRVIRGNMTTRGCIKRWWRIKRLWSNGKPHTNQPGKWEATARQESRGANMRGREVTQLWVTGQPSGTSKRCQHVKSSSSTLLINKTCCGRRSSPDALPFSPLTDALNGYFFLDNPIFPTTCDYSK